MAWYDPSWSYRKKITIDNTKVAADLTDFPVYLDLSDLGADFHSNVKSDGGDIRITKGDGSTEVAREIVAINTGSQTGEVHFQANGTLSASSDTDFYIYYGNSSANDYATSATYGAENVWSDYSAVYHLNEDPSGSAPQILDSTSNNNHLTSFGTMTSGDSVASQIGKGIDFDGSNDYIEKSSVTGFDIGTGDFTISCWVNPDDVNNTNGGYFDRVFMYGQNTFNNSIFLYVRNTGTFWDNSGTTLIAGSTLSTATWQKISINRVSGSTDMYLDGSTTGSSYSGSENFTFAYPFAIGSETSGANNTFFNGKIDEFRVSKQGRSGDWESTEYNNQNSPSTFYTAGTEESKPDPDSRIIFIG